MKKNSVKICGRKTSTPPTPPMTPVVSMERHAPSGMIRVSAAVSDPFSQSMAAEAGPATRNTA